MCCEYSIWKTVLKEDFFFNVAIEIVWVIYLFFFSSFNFFLLFGYKHKYTYERPTSWTVNQRLSLNLRNFLHSMFRFVVANICTINTCVVYEACMVNKICVCVCERELSCSKHKSLCLNSRTIKFEMFLVVFIFTRWHWRKWMRNWIVQRSKLRAKNRMDELNSCNFIQI